MKKIENGGHFGRHLVFWKKLQGDSWGLLVCYFTPIPEHVLKNSACYEIFPGYNQCSWTIFHVAAISFSVLNGMIAIKLATDIHRVSTNC